MALVKLLQDAMRRGLPYLHWQLGVGRTLLGSCLDTDMEARKAAFVAWAAFLEMADWRPRDEGGVTRFYGCSTDFRGCRVVLTANVYHDGDGSGDQP